MNKLLTKKKWVTLADAARNLSTIFEEDVTQADILLLAVEGEIRLSAYFAEPTPARFGRIEPVMRDYQDMEEDPGWADKLLQAGIVTVEAVEALKIKQPAITYEFSDRIVYDNHPIFGGMKGLWDLFCGGAAGSITLNGGLDNIKAELFGLHFANEKEGVIVEIIASDGAPAKTLPNGAFWVIRTDELKRFESSLSPANNPEPQLTKTERESLLKMVFGMAIAAYGYFPCVAGKRNTATGENNRSISADLQRVGMGVDADTIRKYIKEAEERFKGMLQNP